jgi:hypothetical protein
MFTEERFPFQLITDSVFAVRHVTRGSGPELLVAGLLVYANLLFVTLL